MPSFSTVHPNLQQSGPICRVKVLPSSQIAALLKQQGQQVPSIEITALIDTGASSSAISTKVVQQLNLVTRGITNISTPSSSSHQTSMYDVAILFPNNVYVDAVRVIEATLSFQNIDCLIGRDVLKHGVLIYTGYINQFTLSF